LGQALACLLWWTGVAGADEPLRVARALVGGEFAYTARSGDSLSRIAARFGVDVPVLARDNGLRPTARLRLGQDVRVDNRHIVLPGLEEGLLINVPQRMLYHFSGGTLLAHYPVGLGRPAWPTPLGVLHVRTLEEYPVWDVPPSIQAEMRRQGRPVLTRVPPGPDNPLGRHWIGLDRFDCGIHGTNAPSSIYRFSTHGCVRLHPDDVAELFSRVSVGTPVAIRYEPVLVARLEGPRVFLEVHPDVYRRGRDARRTVRTLAVRAGIDSLLAWLRVEQVINEQEGLARDVTATRNSLGHNHTRE
jgi:L,D-transpeptidase ErfK/SrfK